MLKSLLSSASCCMATLMLAGFAAVHLESECQTWGGVITEHGMRAE